MHAIARYLFAAAFAIPTAAQTPLLRGLDGLVGTWQGEGTTGGQAWTSRTSARWVHPRLLREDAVMEVEGMPRPIAFSTFWFEQQGRLQRFLVNSFGGAVLNTATWDDEVLVVTNETIENGRPVTLRSVIRIGKDEVVTRGLTLRGAGDPQAGMDTTLERTSPKPSDVLAAYLAEHDASTARCVRDLESLIGRYTVEKATPRQDRRKPRAANANPDTLVVERYAGGQALELRSSIGGVEGTQIVGWDEACQQLRILDFNDNGFVQPMSAQVVDGDIVATTHTAHPQAVGAWRWLLEIERGKPVAIQSDTLVNGEPPSTIRFDVRPEKAR